MLKRNTLATLSLSVLMSASGYASSSDDLKGFKEFKGKTIHNLRHILDEGDVTILETDKNAVRVDYHFKQKGSHTLKVNGNILEICNKKREGGAPCAYTISVPKKTLLKEVDVKVGSGDVTLKDVKATRSKVCLSSGNIRVEGVRSNELECYLSSGRLMGKNIKALKTVWALSRGDIILNNVWGHVKATSSSGNIAFNVSTLPKTKKPYEIKAVTGQGRIDVKLPSNTPIFYKGIASGLKKVVQNKATFFLNLWAPNVFVSKL